MGCCSDNADVVVKQGFFQTSRCFKLNYNYVTEPDTSRSDRPNILLLHDIGFGNEYWWCLIPKLACVANVYALDYLGTGRSDAPQDLNCYAIDAITQDINEFIDTFCLAKLYLVGQGLGGLLALNFAALYPCKVLRIVISGTSPLFAPSPDWQCGINPEILALSQSVLTEVDPCCIFKKVETLVNLVDPICCDIKIKLVDQGINKICEYALWLQILGSYDIRCRLKCIKSPVLIINGTADIYTPPCASEYLAAAIENSARMEFYGQGNNIPIFSTTLYNEAVFNFLLVQCDPCRSFFDTICKAMVCTTTYTPAPPCPPPCCVPCDGIFPARELKIKIPPRCT